MEGEKDLLRLLENVSGTSEGESKSKRYEGWWKNERGWVRFVGLENRRYAMMDKRKRYIRAIDYILLLSGEDELIYERYLEDNAWKVWKSENKWPVTFWSRKDKVEFSQQRLTEDLW
jgi:hypothetical protein